MVSCVQKISILSYLNHLSLFPLYACICTNHLQFPSHQISFQDIASRHYLKKKSARGQEYNQNCHMQTCAQTQFCRKAPNICGFIYKKMYKIYPNKTWQKNNWIEVAVNREKAIHILAFFFFGYAIHLLLYTIGSSLWLDNFCRK